MPQSDGASFQTDGGSRAGLGRRQEGDGAVIDDTVGGRTSALPLIADALIGKRASIGSRDIRDFF